MKNFVISAAIFAPVFIYLLLYGREILAIREVSDFLSGEIIVMTIFVVLASITVYSIKKNAKLYKYLTDINQMLSKNPDGNYLAQKVLAEYWKQKSFSQGQLNIPAFIESYIAEHTYEDDRPVIGTMRLIQTFASLTILIGVLGTFIGLVLSLSGINPAQIDQSIMAVLAGVHTAFYTSIAGISYSIIINLHTKSKNSEQLLLQIMLKLENYMHQKDRETEDYLVVKAVDKVRESVDSMAASFIQVANFSKEFELATKNMNKFNQTFKENTTNLSKMFGDMETVTKVFNERSTQIHEDFSKLFTFFDSQQRIVLNVQQAFETSSKEIVRSVELQKTVLTHFTEATTEINQQHEQLLTLAGGKIEGTMESFNQLFVEISSNFTKMIEQNEQQIIANAQTTEKIHQNIHQEQKQLTQTLEEAFKQKKNFEELIVKILSGDAGTDKKLEDLNVLVAQMNEIFTKSTGNEEVFRTLDITLQELKQVIGDLSGNQLPKQVELVK